MTQQTFEEDKTFRTLFPEIDMCVKKEMDIGAYSQFPALLIKMHCLSRQRVKEAIMNLKPRTPDGFGDGILTARNILLKELGLDEVQE